MKSKQHRIINIVINVTIILICVAVIIVSFLIKYQIGQEPTSPAPEPDDNSSNIATPSPEEPTNPPEPDPEPQNTFIDLQSTLNTWLKTLSSTEQAGVMIYDITNNRIAAEYHANQVFDVASVYKLLFAYDGYRQIAKGLEDPNKIITRNTEKGTLTLEKCLDLIIRESYNGCADVMNRESSRVARVNSLIRELGLTSTTNIGLRSTAADITTILRNYWKHADLNDTLWAKLADSMLNQPPSSSNGSPVYDWRRGLPAGFSGDVNVYNKVGWDWNGTYWNVYADAAIVDFAQFNHTYTVVVLTKNLTTANKISNLGRMIEDTVIAN